MNLQQQKVIEHAIRDLLTERLYADVDREGYWHVSDNSITQAADALLDYYEIKERD